MAPPTEIMDPTAMKTNGGWTTSAVVHWPRLRAASERLAWTSRSWLVAGMTSRINDPDVTQIGRSVRTRNW